jgi:hypothetical protein
VKKLITAYEIAPYGRSKAERFVVVESICWVEGEVARAYADKLIGFRTNTADYMVAAAHDLREAFGIPFLIEADK